MLVLTRKAGERILIGTDIYITIVDVRGEGVRIGIDAPRGITINRGEVAEAVAAANVQAATVDEAAEDGLRLVLNALRH
jgi:carbon storage regulator